MFIPELDTGKLEKVVFLEYGLRNLLYVSKTSMKNLSIDIEPKTIGQHKDIGYYEDALTDESGGCSEDGGNEDGDKDIRKMSSQSEASEKDLLDTGKNVESKIQRLKDNVTRTNQFLTELKALSESCQEYIPAIELEVDENGELHKERQVRFVKSSKNQNNTKCVCKSDIFKFIEKLNNQIFPLHSKRNRLH